jgi:single-stranded DNA-binding protein
MIVITAHGRLAEQPTVKIVGDSCVCEFRLLSSRWAKGDEVTEAVNFFVWGEEAERFCESTEKGQLISATGTQETSSYTDAQQQRKQIVKYRMTWYSKGARPRSSRGDGQASNQVGNQGQRSGNGNGNGGNSPSGIGGGNRGTAPNAYAAEKGGFNQRAPTSNAGAAPQTARPVSRSAPSVQQTAPQEPDGFDDHGFTGDPSDGFEDVTQTFV